MGSECCAGPETWINQFKSNDGYEFAGRSADV